MKFRIIYTSLFLVFLAFLFASSSGGRAAAANEGNTGAPGDNSRTCVTCHGNSAAIQITQTIDIVDDNMESIATTGYTPGSTYTVQVTNNVDLGTPTGYGFQLIGINAASGVNGPPADAFSDPADNVQIASVSTGRTYAEHKNASSTNMFSVKWTAPEAGSGVVTFYSCGNGINGNGTTAGDNAACATLEIPEGMPTSTSQLSASLNAKIFPNPVSDQLNLQTYNPTGGVLQMSIVNMMGQAMMGQDLQFQQGTNNNTIDVSQLESGIYFLQLQGKSESLQTQLIKL